jgi:cytochrome c5
MMNRFIGLVLVVLTVAATGRATQGQAQRTGEQQQLFEKGKVALGQACLACHRLNQLALHRKTAEQWRDTVYSMIGRGAQVFPDEIEGLTVYLAATYGPVQAAPAAARTAALPEAEAKTLLTQRCVRCHDLQTATGQPGRSEQEWRQIIARMADAYGAPVNQAERDMLVTYLAALGR